MTAFSRRETSKYTGIPYSELDCVGLFVKVQKELFGKMLTVPDDRNKLRRLAGNFMRYNLRQTDQPVDGDMVLMHELGRRIPDHVGTLFTMAGERWVLHSTEKTDSVMHRARHLPDMGIKIEGYYTWVTF